MPMPPPKPTIEGRRDRHAFHEMGQIVRALEANGPSSADELALQVGAAYWEEGRFERSLGFAVTDGLISRAPDGTLHPV